MSSIQPMKPIASTIVSVIWLACFVFLPTTASTIFTFNLSDAEASNIKWGTVLAVGIIWLLVQLFLEAPGTASRLSMALSGTVLWLGLLLFYHFDDPGYGGPVAFFALVGGLIVVIVWIRYLADEF